MPPVTYTIRPYEPHDRARLLELWAARFGDASRVLRDDLEAVFDSETTVNAYVAERSDGSVHGFVIGRVDEAEQIAQTFKGALAPADVTTYAGLVTEIAVSSQAEGLGVATELLTALHYWLAETHAENVYAISWRRNGHDSFDLFTSAGYEERTNVPEFYTDRTRCPECGGPCTCAASILEYDLAEEAGHLLEREGHIQVRTTPENSARRVGNV